MHLGVAAAALAGACNGTRRRLITLALRLLGLLLQTLLGMYLLDQRAQLDAATARLVDGLDRAASDAGIDHQVARVGSMFTLFFNSDPVTSYDVSTRNDTDRFAAYHRGMLDHGIYLPCSQFEANFVSTAHTDQDLDDTIAAAGKVLAEIA